VPLVIRKGNLATEGDDLLGVGCRDVAPNADLVRVAAGCIVTAEMPDRPDLASWCEAGW
jgi:hypothetical protein